MESPLEAKVNEENAKEDDGNDGDDDRKPGRPAGESVSTGEPPKVREGPAAVSTRQRSTTRCGA